MRTASPARRRAREGRRRRRSRAGDATPGVAWGRRPGGTCRRPRGRPRGTAGGALAQPATTSASAPANRTRLARRCRSRA